MPPTIAFHSFHLWLVLPPLLIRSTTHEYFAACLFVILVIVLRGAKMKSAYQSSCCEENEYLVTERSERSLLPEERRPSRLDERLIYNLPRHRRHHPVSYHVEEEGITRKRRCMVLLVWQSRNLFISPDRFARHYMNIYRKLPKLLQLPPQSATTRTSTSPHRRRRHPLRA